MSLRKLISVVYLPRKSGAGPRIFTGRSILAGIVAFLVLTLAGWHLGAPYLLNLMDDSALAVRERENARLGEQLQALHQLDRSLESQINTLNERTAGISTIVHGSIGSVPGGGTTVTPASIPPIASYESPGEAIRGIGGQIDRLMAEARTELAGLQAIEKQSREDETYWNGIPVLPPVRGPVSRSFGSTRNLLSDDQRVHGGLDIAAPRGEPVRATADGIVTRTGVNASLGRYVDITHGNGYMTRYGHLSEVLAERRKRVKRGETIGRVGMTGKTNGYHIHYEIHHEGRILDPSTWFFPDPDK